MSQKSTATSSWRRGVTAPVVLSSSTMSWGRMTWRKLVRALLLLLDLFQVQHLAVAQALLLRLAPMRARSTTG